MSLVNVNAIILMTMCSLCCGFNMKILMDRIDHLENRFENQNKIRRQEMATIFDKLSVIDSLEAKVNKLLANENGAEKSQVMTVQQKKTVDETQDRDIIDFRNIVLKAFLREKMRNIRFQEDFAKSKSEILNGLDNQTESHANQVDSKMAQVSDDISGIKESMSLIQSSVTDIESKINANTDNIYKLETRVEQVEENITTLQSEVDVKISLLKGEFQSMSQKQEAMIWDISKSESCTDLMLQTRQNSGIFELYPSGFSSTLRVFCDLETDNGGWIVFQRRKDGSVDFDRNWNDYKNGFGDLEGEYWMGNKYLSVLTADGDHELRIDMEDFKGNRAYAKYEHFKVHPESDNYRLEVRGYSGDAGDSLAIHNNVPFSTNNNWNGNSEYCKIYNSGWWFQNNCFRANLNGIYYHAKSSSAWLGIIWSHWKVSSLKFVEMKFQ